MRPDINNPPKDVVVIETSDNSRLISTLKEIVNNPNSKNKIIVVKRKFERTKPQSDIKDKVYP